MDKMPVRTIHVHFSKSPCLSTIVRNNDYNQMYLILDLEGFLSLTKLFLGLLTVVSNVIESIMYRMVKNIVSFR